MDDYSRCRKRMIYDTQGNKLKTYNVDLNEEQPVIRVNGFTIPVKSYQGNQKFQLVDQADAKKLVRPQIR